MASRFVTGVGFTVLLALFMALKPTGAGAESIAVGCPAYPAHLRAARERLGRGDRTGAVTELRRADEALASCLREEAAGASLLARHESQMRSS